MSGSFAQRSYRESSSQNTQQSPSAATIPRSLEHAESESHTVFSPRNPNSLEQEVLGEIIADALNEGSDGGVIVNADISDTVDRDIQEGQEIIGDEEDEEQPYPEQRRLSFWPYFIGIVRKSAINLVLPFINGMMLGFGEILAHEIGFHYHWHGAKVEPPRRLAQRKLQEAGSKYL